MTIDADTLGRTLKLEIDSARARSREEAAELVRSYILQVDVGRGVERSRTRQVALLTIVNAGRRCFPGGVLVRLADDPVLSVPWTRGLHLSEAVARYGGVVVQTLRPERITIAIGDGHSVKSSSRPLIPTFNGWAGGVVQRHDDRLSEERDFPLAGVLAGGLAVSEAFQAQRGDEVAGRREVGLSLWTPDAPWRDRAAAGGSWSYLPRRVWLLGLGHLGQAHAWALGSLPYAEPREVEVMLQDVDRIVPANADTGLLVPDPFEAEMKTRLVARTIEQLGFRTLISERPFNSQSRRHPSEPGLALSGFDHPEPRRALEDAGFDKIIDLGLGAGPVHYLDVLMHSFPSGLDASSAWPAEGRQLDANLLELPAYRDWASKVGATGSLTSEEVRCGMLEVAGRTVGAAFVGAVAASLSVAEAVRHLCGGPIFEALSVSLRSPAYVDVAANTRPGPATNPGFTGALK